MNRIFILSIFIVMFLSCGNSTTTFSSNKFIKPQKPLVSDKLNSYKKTIAYQLDTLFSTMNNKGGFNGSIIVAKSGTVLYKKSFGICNKETNCILSDSSMFQLASVSKVITATSVLMLYERERLDINKEFKFYFKDFPYDGITIKELLNHRSGLPNYIYFLNSEIAQPNYKMSNEEMYNYLVQKNPKAYLKPNTRFNYCNTNYALLALLVEKISGKKFNEFLKEELFKPLGMKHTATIKDIDLNASNITKPYNLKWKPIEFDASDYVLGDKSVYSTPYDLFLFSEALYQNKLIKAETQHLAYSAYSTEKKLSNYGLGWRIKNHEDSINKEVFHNGWWHGYRSAFHRRLKDTLTIVILSNQLNKATYQTYRVYQILDNSTSTTIEQDEE
ncbi:MAG: serine hydrolase domain-containing protein [Bacteroidota bacterium]|nr:serine hydrolase domain-containing protein [Bacteroidota bacterium]